MEFDGDLTELYFLIENLDTHLKEKIPAQIRNLIKSKVNVNSLRYIVGLDESRISNATKAYFSYLYTEYICDDEDEIERWEKLDEMYLEKIESLESKW